MRAKTAKSAWDTLQKEFEGDNRVKDNNLLTLKRQFEMLTMKETKTVHQYSTKLIDIINQIKLQGEDFLDKRVIDKIMVSVLDKFESKISTIEESNDLNQLTINELISKLKAHEKRLSIKGAEVPEKALQAKEKGKQTIETPNSAEYEKEKMLDSSRQQSYQPFQARRRRFPPCRHCQNTNHEERRCWFKRKSQIQCRFCKRYGHMERDCRAKQA
ncbi:hypothetical protein SLA2020_183630 [Shorea laevis]